MSMKLSKYKEETDSCCQNTQRRLIKIYGPLFTFERNYNTFKKHKELPLLKVWSILF